MNPPSKSPRKPVPATFACCAKLYRKVDCKTLAGYSARVAFTLFFCSIFSSTYAQSGQFLNPIPTLTVVEGQAFSYPLQITSSDSEFVRIRLVNKPAGATIVQSSANTPVFSWTPPVDVSNETVIIVQAFDARDASRVSIQRMVLLKGSIATTFVDNAPTDAPQTSQDVSELSNNAALLNNAALPIDQPKESLSDPDAQQSSGLLSQQHAPTLPVLGTQELVAGEQFQLFIRPNDADGGDVNLIAKGLPIGSVFKEVFEGSWSLSWRPSAEQIGYFKVTLVAEKIAAETTAGTATKNNVAAKQSQQVVELAVRDPNKQTPIILASAQTKSNPLAETVDAPRLDIDTDALGLPAADSAVTIEPMSSQIVSAGRTINFPVISRSVDNSKTIVHIDRLPSRASFDINPDGSRTFYWPTSETDQGEHVFRFTAVSLEDASQVAVEEVLIVVGDPAAPGSRPQ